MYNPQVQYPPQMMGQPTPQGGNMPMTQGAMMPPGGMPPGGAMPGGPGAAPMGAQPPGMGQLDPAVIQQILALQAQQGRRASVDRQMALADQLRAEGNSQLTGRRTGLANVGAAALSSYAAKKQMDEAGAKGDALDTERTNAASKYFDLIRGLRGAGSGGGMGGPGMGFGGMM